MNDQSATMATADPRARGSRGHTETIGLLVPKRNDMTSGGENELRDGLSILLHANDLLFLVDAQLSGTTAHRQRVTTFFRGWLAFSRLKTKGDLLSHDSRVDQRDAEYGVRALFQSNVGVSSSPRHWWWPVPQQHWLVIRVPTLIRDAQIRDHGHCVSPPRNAPQGHNMSLLRWAADRSRPRAEVSPRQSDAVTTPSAPSLDDVQRDLTIGEARERNEALEES